MELKLKIISKREDDTYSLYVNIGIENFKSLKSTYILKIFRSLKIFFKNIETKILKQRFPAIAVLQRMQ